MECRIETKKYFNRFSEEDVLGMTPKEHLKRKLVAAGYEIVSDAETVFYDDMFCLDVITLKKDAGDGQDEIHTDLQFHDAVISIKREINRAFISSGVRLLSIDDTHIDITVDIGKGTIVYPGSYISGQCTIGKKCKIGPDVIIIDSTIGEGTEILKSVVTGSKLGTDCKIGPFSHIRPDNSIGDRVKIGAYVEVKKSIIGTKTVIPHLAYVGDSAVGRNCNISCGVITANYDGKLKSKTRIGDNAFVGCNTTLIAPVSIEKDTFIAAGSTITDDVEEGSLAIARSRQTNKSKWVYKTGRKRFEKE